MTTPRTVTSSVEVPVDPATAFAVFTEEIDCWWVQGPINFWDSSRAHAIRIEPGPGGRIVEVYDEATGDGLELGRITDWVPGSRLAWASSIDDVAIEVRFDGTPSGTLVRVLATVADDGADRGGTAWVRATPTWFRTWIAERDHRPHRPLRLARLAVAVPYAKPATAARWLRDVFGFEPASLIPETDPDDDHFWVDLHVGDSDIIVAKAPGGGDGGGDRDGAAAPVPWVFVDDLDAHLARARDGGARITKDIWHYGVRAYEAADLEGHHWAFAQASPVMRR